MRLLAAGVNAFGELNPTSGIVTTFQQVSDDVASILLADMVSLVTVSSDKMLSFRGHQSSEHQLDEWTELHSGIGDHTGFKAALSKDGLLFISSIETRLKQVSTRAEARLSLLAMAGNGRVAFVIRSPVGSTSTLVGEAATFEDLLRYISAEQNDLPASPVKWHELQGQAKQLVGGLASFALLMADGSLYTWGDPRYRTLARNISGPDAEAGPDTPANVEALAGVNVIGIALGGWMGGAISNDGALYVWGSHMPGREHNIACLKKQDDEHVTLVSIAGSAKDEPDVQSIAVGHGYAVLTTADGRIFGIGENKYGQLGRTDASFFRDWTQLDVAASVHSVICGPRTTLLLVE